MREVEKGQLPQGEERRGGRTHHLPVHHVRSRREDLLHALQVLVVDKAKAAVTSALLVHHEGRVRDAAERAPVASERLLRARVGDRPDKELVRLLAFGAGDGTLGVDLRAVD